MTPAVSRQKIGILQYEVSPSGEVIANVIGDENIFSLDTGDGEDGMAGLTAILEPGQTATMGVSHIVKVTKQDGTALGTVPKSESLKYTIPSGLTNFPLFPSSAWADVEDAAYKVRSLVNGTWTDVVNDLIPAGGAFKKIENIGSEVLKVKNAVAQALMLKHEETVRSLVPGNMEVFGDNPLSASTVNTLNPRVTVFMIIE